MSATSSGIFASHGALRTAFHGLAFTIALRLQDAWTSCLCRTFLWKSISIMPALAFMIFHATALNDSFTFAGALMMIASPINCYLFVTRKSFQLESLLDNPLANFQYLPDTLLCLPVIPDLMILSTYIFLRFTNFFTRSYAQVLHKNLSLK